MKKISMKSLVCVILINLGNFENFAKNVEKTLDLKQSEYNFLLDSKDQEIKLLQEEILKLNQSGEIVKRDRIRDQKILSDYENEVNHLSSKLGEIPEVAYESNNKEYKFKLEVNFK
jgi:hypothetical protein